MPRINQDITFEGGLNFDTKLDNLPKGDYRFMVNMRNTRTTNGNWGGVVNVKGNVLVEYELPSGENKVIGRLENKEKRSIDYFLWNSNENHRILTYELDTNTIYEVLLGSNFNFNKEWLITQPTLIDDRYLQWTDNIENGNDIIGNPLRYVDKKRAILYNKQVEFSSIVSSNDFNKAGVVYKVKIYYKGSLVADKQVLINTIDNINNKTDLYDRLASAINNDSILKNYVVVDSCGGCKLHTKFNYVGDYWFELYSTSDTFYNLPQNRYHKDWDEYSINLGKRPPLYSPKLNLIVDEDYNYNYIDGKFFQFATRYTYWDNQQSTLSPFSEVGASPLICGSLISPYNVIEVDFSSDILSEEKYLSDIKYVEILVREGNTGHFKSVKKIEVCDIDFPEQKYQFKNDGSYPVISDDDAYRPYDYIPINALSKSSVDDRNYIGYTKENYDNLNCIDAKVDIRYKEKEECAQEYVTIKGKIRVQSLMKKGLSAEGLIHGYVFDWQPIWSTNGEKNYFGHAGNLKLGTNKPDNDVCAVYKQEIPMGGFVTYLAGTNHYAISVQNPIIGIIGGSETNVFKMDSLGDLKDYINNAKNECYSTFEIKNVPKGSKYIVRIASNLVSPDDRYGSMHNINNGIEWQKTSTYLYKINGVQKTEIEVDTDIIGDKVEIDGFFDIVDLTANTDGKSTCAAGYCFDEFSETKGSIDEIKKGARVELLHIDFTSNFLKFFLLSPKGRTDHNGFFFVGVSIKAAKHPVLRNITFKCNDKYFNDIGKQAYKGMLMDLYGGSLTTVTEIKGLNDGVDFYIVYNHDNDITKYRSTYIKGKITDQNGNGVGGVTVVSSHRGRTAISEADGEFKYLLYSSYEEPTSAGTLYLYSNNRCCPKIEVNDVNYRINPLSEYGGYNRENIYNITIPSVVVNTEGNGVWKHRNNIWLGVKYYDDYGRSGKVQTDENKLKTYIPFWTEANGNKGLPMVSWEINHLPPSWAKMFQIVRIKNPIYNKFLQLFISEVKYVKSYGQTVTETTYEGGDATEIYFSLQSLVDYQNENSGSILSWEFNTNDRITLMKDANGDWFDKYYDFRVENDRLDALLESTSLVIKNDISLPKLEKGIMIEIWNPKSENTQDIFYEISECYAIENGYHKGGIEGQNQTSLQPAKGTITKGDVYYTPRIMPIIKYGSFTPPNPPPIDTKEYKQGNFETEYLRENIAESRVQSIGRLDIEDKDFRQIIFTSRVRFSGRYMPETSINQLNRFNYTDFVKDNLNSEIDRAFGGVMYLGYTANVLLAVCKNKTVPIYINATQTYEVDGSGSQIMRSNRIANLGLPIKEERGTQNPESVTIENGELYAWDISKGVWWRYQYSGIFDISDYDANTYFSNISKLLLAQTDKKVFSSYDRDNDELIVSIPSLNITISFNNTLRGEVRKNRWMTTYSYIPDMVCPVQRGFVSFKNGALWLHNTNESRCSFYGVRYECGVDAVVNLEPNAKKIFWKIKEITNALFYTEKKGIEVYGLRNDDIQISQLSAQHFEIQEGDWRADFRRNMKDKYFNDIEEEIQREVTALLRGEVLKGNTMLIKLRNFDKKEVILYLLNIEMSDSQTTIK
ncbi:MAG TPA: hypothetical protein PKK80_02060 [Bacilli bacterium]|nr:hypothetical protein [Bacilli bacterium]